MDVLRRHIGRVTIVEQPDCLTVIAPFFSRGRAVALGIGTAIAFALVDLTASGGPVPRTLPDAIGMTVLFGVCGYYALVMMLNRSVATIRPGSIVMSRGPIPMWPARTIDTAKIVDVRTAVVTGMTGRGGRMEVDTVMAVMAAGPPKSLVDDAGDAGDAARIAGTIVEWLAAHSAT